MTRAELFIAKLADLVQEYDADIGYTTDDDGIHITVDDEEYCLGFIMNSLITEVEKL